MVVFGYGINETMFRIFKKIRPRILFIAFPYSIHTARWISQISDQEWDIYLYPSIDYGITHQDLKNLTVFHTLYWNRNRNKNLKIRGIPVFNNKVASYGNKIISKLFPKYKIRKLKRIIKKLKPDIIHSHETQNAGYLTMKAKKIYRGNFPQWIHSNWGSDIYLYGNISEHISKIHEVLENCDYYTCECCRDVKLARDFGYKGEMVSVIPNGGGYDFERLANIRDSELTSERRLIMLKGYQGWAGRCLVGLRALERCHDILKGYKIIIYSASTDDVFIKSELFKKFTGIEIKIIPLETPHEEILRLHGRSRISIALNISDAISTSLLEAMIMGSFPIQSWTSCADEWIHDGETGLLVPPEDPEIIEKAIRRALTDDELVNSAVAVNYQVVQQRLDQDVIIPKVIELYERLLNRS